MLILNLIILLLFIAGMLLSSHNSNDIFKSIDKKEHKLYPLYPLADWILIKTGLEKTLKRKQTVTDAVKALYVTTKPELLQRLYWCKRISLVLFILVIFNLLSLLGQLSNSGSSVIKNGKYLIRPEPGEGSKEVQLDVILQENGEKQGETKQSDRIGQQGKTKQPKETGRQDIVKQADRIGQQGKAKQPKETGLQDTVKQPEGIEQQDQTDAVGEIKHQEITINVEERAYTDKETEELLKKAYQYLQTAVLGRNKSADKICENLNFIGSIPGSKISVEWQPEDYNLIQSDGTVNNQNISTEGINTTVDVKLSLGEHKSEHTMSFRIMPKQYTGEEQLRSSLEKEIETYAGKSAKENYMELPETLKKYRLSWAYKGKSNLSGILLLGILAAVMSWLLCDKELEKQLKKRKEQMLFDYPEIINKFTLLVNAGMTVRQAWNKVAEDYNDKLSQKKRQKHYAYEEMIMTANELKLGLPETIAYEQFGRRIGLIPYIKFASLISQNLKKGNKGFTDLLIREAVESFEDRKEIAKRLGEEAGTKLLIPMMFMLIIVLLIIMIPAFWSFKI